ncbi:MAG: protein kinase domain-containing protein [Bryobacteraceae bacterium]
MSHGGCGAGRAIFTTRRFAINSGPRSIGQYRILQLIGRGGMGSVYLATDTVIGREVALKLVDPAFGVDLETARELRSRLLREAQTAGVLTHPNVITIHHAGEDGDVLYIVMEFVHGQPLSRLMSGIPCPRGFTISVLGQCASALDFAHSRGVLHRDVKPSNILIDLFSRPKLCDFGIAKWLAGQQATSSMYLLGSPSYMAPEQALGSALSPATDQYSLAVVAYEMLAGKKPFLADTLPALMHCHLSQPPPAEPLRTAGLPEAAVSVLMRGLAKDPGQRFQTCTVFVDALSQALSGAQVEWRSPAQDMAMPISCDCLLCNPTGSVPLVTAPGPVATEPRRGQWEGADRAEEPHLAGVEPIEGIGGNKRTGSGTFRAWWGRPRRFTRVAAGAAVALAVVGGSVGTAWLTRQPTDSRRGTKLEEKAPAWESDSPDTALSARLPEYPPRPVFRDPAEVPGRPPWGRAETPAGNEAPGTGASRTPTPGPPAEADRELLRTDAPWPTARANAARTGLALVPGLKSAEIAWSVTFSGTVAGSPVIDQKGRIFVATSDRKLHCIEEGTLLWSLDLPDPPAAHPDLMANGDLKVPLKGDGAWRVTADGKAVGRWQQQTRPLGWASDSLGHVYFVAGLRLLRSPGAGWEFPLEEVSDNCLAVTEDLVLTGTRGGNLYAITQDGRVAWMVRVPGRITAGPSLLPEGSVVFGTLDGQVYCVRNGEVLWRQSLEGAMLAAAAVSGDGILYAGAVDGNLYAFRADGELLWRLPVGSEIRTAPALDAEGRIYVATMARRLYCISSPRRRATFR